MHIIVCVSVCMHSFSVGGWGGGGADAEHEKKEKKNVLKPKGSGRSLRVGFSLVISRWKRQQKGSSEVS